MSDRTLDILLTLRAKIARFIPRSVVHFAGIVLGGIAFRLVSSRRKVALSNVQTGLNLSSHQALALTRKVFNNLGLMITEIVCTPTISEIFLSQNITMEGQEYLEQARDSNQNGIILFTGHFGNFELLGGIISALGLKPNVISREQDNASAQRFLVRVRHQYGLSLYPRGMGLREAYRALKKGETLVLLGDQEARSNGWFVDFFGRPASTFPGVVQMAQRSGAVILPVFLARVGVGKHKVIFRPPTRIERTASEEELREILQELTHTLESVIRDYPDQWFWIHKRWKTQPHDCEESTSYANESNL